MNEQTIAVEAEPEFWEYVRQVSEEMRKMDEAQDKFAKLGQSIGELVDTKQRMYGNSFGEAGKVLAILYPYGVPVESMGDMLTIARIVDKLFRVANRQGDDTESPFDDIAGYALLAANKHRTERTSTNMSAEVKSDLDKICT